MKSKFYFLICMSVLSLSKSQTPELLYYKFEGTASNIPNLASNPPAGAAKGEIVGNLNLGTNTTCLGNGLVGTNSLGASNYFDTKWNLSLSGSWTMHMKLHNYVSNDNSVYYLLGDTLSPGSSFRMFTNGTQSSGNVNAIRIFATGMTSVLITNVFPSNNPVDLIVIYDSSLQQIRTYVNGILNSTTTQSLPLVFNGGLFRLGGFGGSGTGMKTGMVMDEFGLFNRVITDAEIASLNSFCSVLSTGEMIKSSGKKITVYKDTLILEKGNFEKYQIFDYSGRVVLSGNESSNSINIGHLQKGNYIIKFDDIAYKFKY